MRRRVLMLVLLAVVLGCGVAAGVLLYNNSESKSVVVPLDQVPEPFLKTAREKLPDVKFDHAHKLSNGNYEIRGKTKNGKVREVEVNSAGEVVEVE